MAAVAGSGVVVFGRVSLAAQNFATACSTAARKSGRLFVQNVADPEVLKSVADAVPANRQQTAPAVSRLPRVLTTRTKSGKPGAPREWPEEPQQASRARRLVTLPFAPIKKLGRSISNSKLASAFFFSGGSPRETQDAEARRTRTTSTDTIPEETSIISNVDASSQAQEPSPRLQRSRTGSGLLRKLSLKPIRVRRSSSLADKRL
ncbi:hypothetical protein WJX74_010102 [Apatococcus lobatus]|uniref:Uncharacterized protein n=2 Tax=Apatococcus TaxID=904362 RepID=A0AAW1TAI0_9CHLO